MKKILFLCLTFTFAAELEVEGDLKVTGSVDASGNPVKNIGLPTTLNDAINGNALQDALRDDGTYEFMFLYMRFIGSGNAYENTERHVKYIVPTDTHSGDINWSDGGISKLNQLMLEGWKISTRLASGVGSDGYYIYELKKIIDE